MAWSGDTGFTQVSWGYGRPLDHFDIVNQSSGLVGKRADPEGLFLEHAARLNAAGL